MTIEEQTKIEDNIGVLNSDLSINTNYDKQFRYYQQRIEQEEFTKELLTKED